MKFRTTGVAGFALALAAATSAGVASAQATGQIATASACSTHGGVGTSSATATLPAHTRAIRYYVTVTADQVPNATSQQFVYFSGLIAGDLSATMNAATYNDGPAGTGIIDLFDSFTSVPASEPKSTLTATAGNPGGQVRIAVWACTI